MHPLCIGVGLTYLTGVFFVAEWHVDWVNIQQGWTGFWLKFVGLNLQWSTLSPAAAIGALWLLVRRAQAEALASAQPGGAG